MVFNVSNTTRSKVEINYNLDASISKQIMRLKYTVTLLSIIIGTGLIAQNAINSTKVEIPLLREVNMDELKDQPTFEPRIHHLEAPYPGGDAYRTLLKDQKKKSAALVEHSSSKRTARTQDPGLNPILIDGLPMTREVPNPAQDTTYIFNVVGGTPLDNTMAISANGILLASVNSVLWGYDVFNDSILFKNADGSTNLISFAEFGDTLVPNPGQTFPFDPKLLYDSGRDRFVFVFLDGRGPNDSQCIVGFSSTNDPRDPWYVYSIPGDPRGQGNNWTDYPAISLTEDELFFTVNMIIPNMSWQAGFDGTVIWQINLDDGFSGAATLNTRLWDGITYNGKYIRYLCPVESAAAPQGPNAYFMSNHPWDAQNDTLFLVEVTNTADQSPLLNISALKSPLAYGMPPNGRQEDTPPGLQDSLGLQTNDARYLGAVLNGSTIHAVANTRDFSTGNAAVYHAIINNVDGTPSAQANLIGVDSLDLGYPKICYAGEGTPYNQYVIGFNHTSPTVYAGISATVYDASSGNYSEVVRLKEGLGYVRRLSGAYERWGDYFGIQAAPYAPGRVWTAGFYGLANRSSSTWMNELSLNDDNLLGIADEIPQMNSRIFPNPAFEQFYVDFEVTEETEIALFVYDLQGREVENFGKALAKPGKNRFTFRADELPEGMYLVVGYANGNRVFAEKLIREQR
jgi:hypothetical protein